MTGKNGFNASLDRRSFLGAGLATLTLPLVGFVSRSHASDKTLTIAMGGGILEDAYRKAYFESFEQKTGYKIVTAPYVETARFKAMVESGSIDIDIAEMDASESVILGEEGLLDEIDIDRVSNPSLIAGAVEKYAVHDYVTGCVCSWNTDAVKKLGGAPKNWGEFFDPHYRARRSLWKNAGQTVDLAALATTSKESLYPLNVDRAFETLDAIRPSITWWSSGAQSAQLLADNETDIGFCWNGRIETLKRQGAPVDYSFENALLVWGNLVLPKGGPKREIAMQFFAHMLQADEQARFSQAIPYGPVNSAAFGRLSDEQKSLLPTFPQNLQVSIWSDYKYWAVNGRKVYDRFNNWLSF